MKTATSFFAALAATAVWATAALAEDAPSKPIAPADTPHITTAVAHSPATISDVALGRRAARRGYYASRPYYSYRPYYGGYGYGYGGYYRRPYYGYSYYAPGWGAWGPGYSVGWGVPPLARFGTYWW
jgi:hypothetical protein